jgi:thiosulfate/3-mercaptopyruvate sulfurtransferase
MAARAAGASPLIIDCSFDLADAGAGERAFAQAHLPGAVYAHLDRDLAGAKTGRNGRHPLPARADWAATLARLGVTPARAVVVYDAQGGMYAARAWWMLRWVGHRAASVLDGGLGAWTAAGGAHETGAVRARRLRRRPIRRATAWWRPSTRDALLKSLGRVTLLDARAGERYRGEVEPLDARAGHIPGARSRFFKDNLDAQGHFRPATELRAAFRRSGRRRRRSCISAARA